MPTLLHIDASPMGESSVSRRLTQEFAKRWLAAHPQGKVLCRDLTKTIIPVIDAEWVAANYTLQESRTEQQNARLKLAAEFTGELMDADEYVMGVPIHNWGPPSIFKLWVDHFVSPFGPKLYQKRATFIITAGRDYTAHPDNISRNYVEPWLRTLFTRLHVEDMRFIFVDGAVALINRNTGIEAFLAPQLERIHALFTEQAALVS